MHEVMRIIIRIVSQYQIFRTDILYETNVERQDCAPALTTFVIIEVSNLFFLEQ